MTTQGDEEASPRLLFSEVLTLIAHHATAAAELAMRFQEDGSDFKHHMSRIDVLNAAIATHAEGRGSESPATADETTWPADVTTALHECITTVEQLEGLPGASYDELDDAADIDGTVIKDSVGALYEKNADGTWATDGDPAAPNTSIRLPALLLWHPNQHAKANQSEPGNQQSPRRRPA